MAFGAVDLSGNVPHVREVDVVRDLVDPNPRNRLLIPGKVHKLLDLGLLPFVGPTNERVAAHARPDRWDAGSDRPLRREVTVLAVDSVHAGVDGMRERDRLGQIDLTVGDRRRTTVLRLYQRRKGQEDEQKGEGDEGCANPSLRQMPCHARWCGGAQDFGGIYRRERNLSLQIGSTLQRH